MKNLFLLLVVVALHSNLFAQEDQWITRTKIIETQECIDSLTCYSNVFIEINEQVLIDSTYIVLSIGSTPQGSDIYSNRIQYLPTIDQADNVRRSEQGVLEFYLGKYIVSDSFFIDSFVE